MKTKPKRIPKKLTQKMIDELWRLDEWLDYQVVGLLLGINPEWYQANWEKVPEKIRNTISSALSSGMNAKTIQFRRSGFIGNPIHHINRKSLVKWAEGKFKLPKPSSLLKKRPYVSTREKEDSYESSPLLNLTIDAAKKFFPPNRTTDPKRNDVHYWLTTEGKTRCIPISTNIATAIFTIIKPTNHNPKKRKG